MNALKPLSAQQFVSQTKSIVQEELTRRVAKSQIHVFHKKETTMVIYVLSTAPPFAPKTRYFAKDQKENQAVKNPIHVTISTPKLKETILVVYVLAIVPKTVWGDPIAGNR